MIYVLIAVALVVVCFFLMKRSGPSITRGELMRALESGEKMLLLDVRSEKEFQDGHVPGAINMPHKSVLKAPNEVSADRSERIVVYCECGPRAKKVQTALLSAGFTNVVHLEGDMSGWRTSGMKAET